MPITLGNVYLGWENVFSLAIIGWEFAQNHNRSLIVFWLIHYTWNKLNITALENIGNPLELYQKNHLN